MENDNSQPPAVLSRVEIGGRTMLRPGFSLVGLIGLVFPPDPSAPPGSAKVAIDWPAQGYTLETGYPDGSLPAFVNVPIEHLRVLGEDEIAGEVAAPEPKKWKPKQHELSKGAPPEPEAAPEPQAPLQAPLDDEPPADKPRLRLI